MELTKQLVLRIPESTHRDLKILAAETGQSMTEMILSWLQEKCRLFKQKKEKNLDPVLKALTSPLTPQEKKKLRKYSDEELKALLEEDSLAPELAARIDKLLSK